MSVTVCRRLQQHFTEMLVIPKWHSNWVRKRCNTRTSMSVSLLLWLAAVVGGTLGSDSPILLNVYFNCVQKTGRQAPTTPEEREFATLGGSGWQQWWRGYTGFGSPLNVFISCASRTQVEGSHNPRRAKSREFATFGVVASWYTQLFFDPGRKGGYVVATQTCKALRSRKRGKSKHGGAKMNPDRSQTTNPNTTLLKSASGHHPLRGLWLSTRSPSKPHNPKIW